MSRDISRPATPITEVWGGCGQKKRKLNLDLNRLIHDAVDDVLMTMDSTPLVFKAFE